MLSLLSVVNLFLTPQATASAENLSSPDYIYLTWASPDTAHTMNISWHTNENYAGEVRYDNASHGGDSSAYSYSENGSGGETTPQLEGYIHHVELTGLEPGGTYYFVCGSSDYGWSDERSFRTAPASETDIRFAAGGDSRADGRYQFEDWPEARDNVSETMASYNPDFVTFNGDFLWSSEDPGGDDYAENDTWDNWLGAADRYWNTSDGRMIPLVPVIGNHEITYPQPSNYDPATDATNYYTVFNLPGNERWYSLSYGPELRLIVLDGEILNEDSSTWLEQYNWLENELQSSDNYTWNIVTFHRPIVDSAGINTTRLENWGYLFSEHDVDLALSGHHHYYERSYPVDETGQVTSLENGFIQIISGAWGAPLSSPYPPENYTAHASEARYSFLLTDVFENKTLKTQAIDTDNITFDENYLQKKQPSGGPTPHSPIYIDGDSDFSAGDNDGVINPGASGTEGDPYIIQNWAIDASTANGIGIRNTTAHFEIRNCLVENGKSNWNNGVFLENVENGTIENNLAENNYLGFCLDNSSGNVLESNLAENNGYGFDLRGSANNNLIFHNRIINNDNQAYDEGSNQWDNGYPSGGNYWSDYKGTDNYHGENQDIPGSDRIGDTPYSFSGGQDNYPLMEPWHPKVGLTPHDPIYIDGDSDFSDSDNDGVTNPGAAGTENDPYIIQNWIIDASTSTGIEIWNTTAHFVIRNCMVENGNSSNNNGIHLYNVKKGRIKNNNLVNDEKGLCIRESSSNALTNNFIENSVYWGIELINSSNNTVENNLVEKNRAGMVLWDSTNNVIRNNIGRSNNNEAIGLHSSRQNEISQNTTNNNQSGITLKDNSNNNTIRNNVSKFNEYGGIGLHYSPGNEISNNITKNNGGWGIVLGDNSNNNTLRNNVSRLNKWEGIQLHNSERNEISNNTTVNNGSFAGIALWDNSNNNTLRNNVSKFNNYAGIGLDNSGRNEVSNNNITKNNKNGIILRNNSDNNIIYHNNFLNNNTQAYDSSSNQWDKDYPSGGNYWSDYTGEDADNDGIGDTSYEIPGDNNKDHYPLMRTWSPRPSVEVSISPSEDNAPPGYTLSYEVTVTNTGNISDSYDLTVTENAAPSWDPILDKGLFENIIPGENCTTVLEVTVPDNANFGIEDNIVVTATSQENAQVTDNTSRTALSAALVRGVKVTVSPGLKGGYLGSTLEYSVTVKNEGNVPDNYELDASVDIDPSWNPTFADNLIENVAPGEEKTATLSVTIPENDNLIGVIDTITITATSQENTLVSDSEICHAEAVEPPVGGVFHPADRKSLQEQGRGTLTAFVVSLVALITALIFAVWWRRRE